MAERRARVLVIDDDPKLVRLVARMLGGEHEVVPQTSAQDALKLIEQTKGERVDMATVPLDDLKTYEQVFHRARLNRLADSRFHHPFAFAFHSI